MPDFPQLEGSRLHLFGIAGRGMAPLAIVAKHLGANVDGCDRSGIAYARRALADAQIDVMAEHDASHLREGVELVATSIAPADDPEIGWARERDALWHRTDLLAAALRTRPGAAITGSHGKGTVVALTAVALAAAGLDPLALVGAHVPKFASTVRLGAGPLVAEVDDSDLSLGRVSSKVAVVTNLDYDHPHLAIPLSKAIDGVGQFVARATERVILGPSPRSETLAGYAKAGVWRYGSDYSGRVLGMRDGVTRLQLSLKGFGSHAATVRLIGPRSASNAALAFACAVALGAEPAQAAAGLENLESITRRLELVGTNRGVRVFDDFGGKHPVNIREGLTAIRRHYPNARITAVFEPYGPYLARWGNRYARSLGLADSVVLLPARYLADYPATTVATAEDWYSVCPAPVQLVEDQEAAVRVAIRESGSGDVVVFFSQINLSRSMALAAAGISE